MIDLPTNKQIILFDGFCNLCNGAIQKIIKYDTKNTFVFASLTSNTGQQIINSLKIDTTKIDSIILYNPGIAYSIKSTAALNIAAKLSGFWKLTYIFWLLPEFIRDYCYDVIAKNRYLWFGKKDHCMIPTKALTAKFLD